MKGSKGIYLCLLCELPACKNCSSTCRPGYTLRNFDWRNFQAFGKCTTSYIDPFWVACSTLMPLVRSLAVTLMVAWHYTQLMIERTATNRILYIPKQGVIDSPWSDYSVHK